MDTRIAASDGSTNRYDSIKVVKVRVDLFPYTMVERTNEMGTVVIRNSHNTTTDLSQYNNGVLGFAIAIAFREPSDAHSTTQTVQPPHLVIEVGSDVQVNLINAVGRHVGFA